MNTPHRLRTATLCSLLAALPLLGASQGASAQTASVAVSYRDLNLARASDLQRLYRRLQDAAEHVCIITPTYELARYAVYQRCLQATLEQAVLQVHSADLLALHRSAGRGATRMAAMPASAHQPSRND